MNFFLAHEAMMNCYPVCLRSDDYESVKDSRVTIVSVNLDSTSLLSDGRISSHSALILLAHKRMEWSRLEEERISKARRQENELKKSKREVKCTTTHLPSR